MPDDKSTHHHHHHHHYGDNGPHAEYARRAGQPGPGPNPHRLRRNVRSGKVAGVCAGLADYFGWRVKWVRLAWIGATLFFFPMPIFVYLGFAICLRAGDPVTGRYASPEEERFWRTYSVKPKATLSELKHRFRAIDARIAEMEKVVTSSEYRLRREFRNLEEGRA